MVIFYEYSKKTKYLGEFIFNLLLNIKPVMKMTFYVPLQEFKVFHIKFLLNLQKQKNKFLANMATFTVLSCGVSRYIIGASRPPTGSPKGLPTFFFFFFFSAALSVAVCCEENNGLG